jgi:hypothetical protein
MRPVLRTAKEFKGIPLDDMSPSTPIGDTSAGSWLAFTHEGTFVEGDGTVALIRNGDKNRA